MSLRVKAIVIVVACATALLVAALSGGSDKPAVRRAHPPGFGTPPKGQLAAPLRSGVSTVEMLDTVSTGDLNGLHPYAVAGYTGGSWPTFYALQREGWAHIVPIAVFSGGATFKPLTCLDVEPGDASPSQAGAWARAQLNAGIKPCLYANGSEMGAVQSNVAAWGIRRDQWFEWLAYWTYSPGLRSGSDCTQWTDRAYGRNLDESTCASYVFGPPPPPPDPHKYALFTTHRFGGVVERDVVEHYDGARQHPKQYAHYIGYLEGQLRWLADRVWHVAVNIHHGHWDDNNLGFRYQQLKHRGEGRDCGRSWEQCN